MAEGELVEARAKLMESHSEDMTDQLQKYQGMVCPEHSVRRRQPRSLVEPCAVRCVWNVCTTISRASAKEEKSAP